MLGLLQIPYTAIPQQEVIVPATPGGIANYATITTDSYLSQALQGMMQNASAYVGWSLNQWIQAFIQQALQRCTAYPASCAGTDAETLGTKYGTIAYNLMSTVTNTSTQQQSNPNGIDQGPANYVVVPTPINTTQNPGANNAFGPAGTPTSQVDTPAQQAANIANVNPNNTQQSVLAQTGGTPVSNNPASVAMQSVPSGICVDAGNGTYEDTGNGAFCGSSLALNAGSYIGGVPSGICVLGAGGTYIDSGNGTPCTPTTPTTSNVTVGNAPTTGTDPISELENYSFSLFGMQITGLEAVLGIAAIGIVGMMLSGKKGR